MNIDESKTIKVYVANLGKYNEGIHQGEWITLPMPKEELDRVLSEEIGLELDPEKAFQAGMRGEVVYEEYAIHDYDYDFGLKAIGYIPSEYDNLDDLNALAAQMQKRSLEDLENVNIWLNDCVGTEKTISNIANLVIQAEDIPFSTYEFEGIENSSNMSNETKLGYTFAELFGIQESLEAINAECYFDYEKYGNDCSFDYALSDKGYFDMTEDGPSLEQYGREDIKAALNEIFSEEQSNESQQLNPVSLKEEARDAKAASAQLASEQAFDTLQRTEKSAR